MLSPSTPTWWSRVDRQAVVDAARSLVRDPKLFALIGDASSGLSEAAMLAEEEFDALGRKCLRLSDLDVQLPTLKYRLLKLLDGLTSPSSPASLPASLFLASSGIAAIGHSLARVISSLDNPIALVIERADSHDFPRRNDIFELQEIARVSNTPIILTGDARYRWNSSMPQSSIIYMTDFGRDEVRDCMLSAPPLAGWSHQRIDDELDSIFGDSANVPPLDVFARLKVLAQ